MLYVLLCITLYPFYFAVILIVKRELVVLLSSLSLCFRIVV